MKFLRAVLRRFRPREENEVSEALAHLILAARDDAAFRQRVAWVLALPAPQRESLIASAVEEMRLRGEPQNVCAAFSVLATPQGAAAAARLISGG